MRFLKCNFLFFRNKGNSNGEKMADIFFSFPPAPPIIATNHRLDELARLIIPSMQKFPNNIRGMSIIGIPINQTLDYLNSPPNRPR